MYHSILEDIANCFVNSGVRRHITYFTRNTVAVQTTSLTILVNLATVFCKKNSNNVALFKTTLKKFLLQYIFYSVDEYYQQNCNDYDYQ